MMTPDDHVTHTLREAYDHAVVQADNAAGLARRTAEKAVKEQAEAQEWAGRRDALRAELDTRVVGAEERAALDQPAGPTLSATGPDLMASGGRPMRTSPLGPR